MANGAQLKENASAGGHWGRARYPYRKYLALDGTITTAQDGVWIYVGDAKSIEYFNLTGAAAGDTVQVQTAITADGLEPSGAGVILETFTAPFHRVVKDRFEWIRISRLARSGAVAVEVLLDVYLEGPSK